MKRGGEMFPGKEKWFHLMGGMPDDDCPVCRAHGISPEMFAGGPGGFVIIEMDGPRAARDCSCPLCRQINFDA